MTSCRVASRHAGLRWQYISRVVVVGNVGDNSVSNYRLRASETQQLADAASICYQCGVAGGEAAAVNQRRADLQQSLATQRLSK